MSHTTLEIIFWITVVLGLAGVGLAVVIIIWAWQAARKEVGVIPRVPMLYCDTHGPFPQSSALYIEVPAVTTGKVEMCPMCFYERVKEKPVPVLPEYKKPAKKPLLLR